MDTIRKLFKIENRLDTRGILRVSLIAFVLLCLLGTIPYLATGACSSFIHALFESVSGFTTTGATSIPNVNLMPTWVLCYRAFTQWIGGAAVLIFLSATLKSFDADSSIGNADASASLYRSGIRFSKIAARLLFTYFSMTLICFLALIAAGFKPAGAFIYALSTISTGGFGAGDYVNFNSLNNSMQTVILIFMILSCINFSVYYHIIKKHFKKILNSTELFTFLSVLIGGAILVIANLYLSGTLDLQKAVHFGTFEATSYMTTTGIHIIDISAWPSFSKMILHLLSFIGGCTASVGSGMKVLRFVLLIQLIPRAFISRIHPAAVKAIKVNGRRASGSAVTAAFAYFITLLLTYAVSLFLISFEAPDIETAMTLTTALINNTGGINCTDYSGIMKLIMCIIMLAGRLELYAVILPFSRNNGNL